MFCTMPRWCVWQCQLPLWSRYLYLCLFLDIIFYIDVVCYKSVRFQTFKQTETALVDSICLTTDVTLAWKGYSDLLFSTFHFCFSLHWFLKVWKILILTKMISWPLGFLIKTILAWEIIFHRKWKIYLCQKRFIIKIMCQSI